VHTKFWSEKLKGRGNLGDLSVDGRITKWIVEKFDVKLWTEFK